MEARPAHATDDYQWSEEVSTMVTEEQLTILYHFPANVVTSDDVGVTRDALIKIRYYLDVRESLFVWVNEGIWTVVRGTHKCG